MADYLATVSTTAIHQSPNRKRTRDPVTSYRTLSKNATSCKAEAAALVNGSLDDVKPIPVTAPSTSTNAAVKSKYSSIQSRKQINGNGSCTANTGSSSKTSNGKNTCDSCGIAGNRVQQIVSLEIVYNL